MRKERRSTELRTGERHEPWAIRVGLLRQREPRAIVWLEL